MEDTAIKTTVEVEVSSIYVTSRKYSFWCHAKVNGTTYLQGEIGSTHSWESKYKEFEAELRTGYAVELVLEKIATHMAAMREVELGEDDLLHDDMEAAA